MDPSHAAQSFQEANPDIKFLSPKATGYAERRETRGQAGHELTPLGIAIPETAEQVSRIVRSAVASSTNFTVRTGGNDFYGRFVADGGVVIDMREIKGISLAADRSTVSIGGGTITKDLVCYLEAEGLVAPMGNTWIVGYVGWATLGGYGPLANLFGMGFEGIVGAQLVNANGDIVDADDDMLEGIRGLGGNLGVVTSLTIKVYPAMKLMSGILMFEATEENIRGLISAEQAMELPRSLNVHTFIMSAPSRILALFYTWYGEDLQKAKKELDTLISAVPPIMKNTVMAKTMVKHHEDVPLGNMPWGGQRSLYVRELSPKVIDTLVEGCKAMSGPVNMSWSGKVNIDQATAPKNCFGARTHRLVTFADMVPHEDQLAAAQEWTDSLYNKFRSCGDEAVMEGAYPPLTRPTDRTIEQLLGEKWARAKELKDRFDPENVFKFAVPRMGS